MLYTQTLFLCKLLSSVLPVEQWTHPAKFGGVCRGSRWTPVAVGWSVRLSASTICPESFALGVAGWKRGAMPPADSNTCVLFTFLLICVQEPRSTGGCRRLLGSPFAVLQGPTGGLHPESQVIACLLVSIGRSEKNKPAHSQVHAYMWTLYNLMS